MSPNQTKPKAVVTTVTIDYNDKKVQARNLRIFSEIPMNIKSAWDIVKRPELLRFVARGMMSFDFIEKQFPREWQAGETYRIKLRLFGFIPFGGIHYLLVEEIDNENYELSTREWDKTAKVWNHQIIMRELSNRMTYYEDSIIIYGGILTGIITSFAKHFYIHRQKRWQVVAKENLEFGGLRTTKNHI